MRHRVPIVITSLRPPSEVVAAVHAYGGIVLHGAEVTVPGRLPGSSHLLRRVLRGASLVVAAGGYPLAEAERAARATLPSVLVPPGVDTDRFVPLSG